VWGVNERLRAALAGRGWTVEDLARKIELDPKSVRRWITKDRVPHLRNRCAAAELLEVSPEYLWPDAHHGVDQPPAAGAEIVATYPDRASVPRSVWLQLLETVETRIDILVYSGTFLAQTNPKLPAMLAARAAAGAEVRLCFADPAGSSVALRDTEEGLGGTLGAKVRASLTYFAPLVDVPGCSVRLHNAIVYASIFRYDAEALINPHIWGAPASANPLFHLRDTGEDSLFGRYVHSFDQIWQTARPIDDPVGPAGELVDQQPAASRAAS
jgi:transcriptional regulator with XRE-family HTH domain